MQPVGGLLKLHRPRFRSRLSSKYVQRIPRSAGPIRSSRRSGSRWLVIAPRHRLHAEVALGSASPEFTAGLRRERLADRIVL